MDVSSVMLAFQESNTLIIHKDSICLGSSMNRWSFQIHSLSFSKLHNIRYTLAIYKRDLILCTLKKTYDKFYPIGKI